MPELELAHSAPTIRTIEPPRAQFTRAQSSTTTSYPRLQHVFSAQHLDDVSNYHGGDHDSTDRDGDNETEYSEGSENVKNDDLEQAVSHGQEQNPELRTGVYKTRDIDPKLEKKETTRSIKDPNLV